MRRKPAQADADRQNADAADPSKALRVLVVTSEWPSDENPSLAVFVWREVESLRRAGVDVDVFAFRGRRNPARYLIARRMVLRRIREGAYHVVHAHFGQAGLLVLGCGLPVVVRFHGSDLEGIVGAHGDYTLSGKILRFVSRFVARRARCRIVVSESLGHLLPAGLSYSVISNAVDLDLFTPGSKLDARVALGMSSEGRFVLFAGNPDAPVKRFGLAVDAMSLLREPGADLVVMCNELPDRVPLYMRACDVLLVTSRHEGGPAVVKEALACNLPVVSVDVGDVRDFIGELDGCVLTSDDRAETIANALQYVFAREAPFVGRSAVTHLDENRLARRLIDIYNGLAPTVEMHRKQAQ